MYARDEVHTLEQARLAGLGRASRDLYQLLSATNAAQPADLLRRLQCKRGGEVTLSTVHHGLLALMRAGLAHRVAHHGYVRCALGEAAHTPAFLVCEACGAAGEHDASGDIARLRAVLGRRFVSPGAELVLSGICARCQGERVSHLEAG